MRMDDDQLTAGLPAQLVTRGMRVIDLSATLESGMRVYPGDPPVRIDVRSSIEHDGWELRHIAMGSHTGTHADAPSHMLSGGASIDRLPLDRFMGPAVLADATAQELPRHMGLLFRAGTVDMHLLPAILAAQPRFVATGDSAHLTLEMERALLTAGIVTITDLAGMDQLPANRTIQFFAVPLKIRDGDGSPVRAFALVEDEGGCDATDATH